MTIPRCILLVLLAAMVMPSAAEVRWSVTDLDHVLERYVGEDGFVDYPGLLTGRAPLDRYVAALGEVSPDSHPGRFPTREHELAYWMNAYNALMLRRVIDAWPVESVKDIRVAYGVFWLERHLIGGDKWALRGLENKIIRKRYDEPRIHFAINCASRGCPAMPRRAWRAETLDGDLDIAARRFVANVANVRFDAGRRVVHLSSIFDWFSEDFTDRRPLKRGVLDYVAAFLTEGRRKLWGNLDTLEVEWIPYDWSINAARASPRRAFKAR